MKCPEYTYLHFIRHGQTDGETAGVVMSNTDIILNRTGIKQAHNIIRTLKDIPIYAIYSSPLSRARETADIIARSKHLPVQIDKALIERDAGIYEGHSFQYTRPNRGHFLTRLPYSGLFGLSGMETDISIAERLHPFLIKVISEYVGKHVLLVSHAGIMRYLLNLMNMQYYKDMGKIRIQNTAILTARGNSFYIEGISISGLIRN